MQWQSAYGSSPQLEDMSPPVPIQPHSQGKTLKLLKKGVSHRRSRINSIEETLNVREYCATRETLNARFARAKNYNESGSKHLTMPGLCGAHRVVRP